jgi:hypothetical protein
MSSDLNLPPENEKVAKTVHFVIVDLVKLLRLKLYIHLIRLAVKALLNG